MNEKDKDEDTQSTRLKLRMVQSATLNFIKLIDNVHDIQVEVDQLYWLLGKDAYLGREGQYSPDSDIHMARLDEIIGCWEGRLAAVGNQPWNQAPAPFDKDDRQVIRQIIKKIGDDVCFLNALSKSLADGIAPD